jgi:hypothetical protein
MTADMTTTRLLPKDRQIYLSGRIWHEILPAVDISPFIYALHSAIDLRAFGTGLKRYYFSFVLMPEGEQINNPYARYDEKSRSADIAVEVPYQEYQTSPEARLQLLTTAYLEGIDQLATLNVPDFDVDAFRAAVKDVFEEEGWYEKWLD